VTNTVKFKIDQEVSNDYITPNLVVRDHGDSVELDWNRIDHAEFKGYKIVVSEDEEAPKYPDDGYMKYIVDKDITSFDIKEGMEAYNSDFNGISYNEEYYASITVLYKNGKTYSNTVAFELEEEDKNYIEPSLDLVVDEENSIAKLSWTRIDHSEFEGYKVVVSKSESTPEYPENGYVTYITDKNQSKFELTIGTKSYNSDFYKIEAGQKYYVAITAVYKDGKVTGNVENFELTVEAEEREDE